MEPEGCIWDIEGSWSNIQLLDDYQEHITLQQLGLSHRHILLLQNCCSLLASSIFQLFVKTYRKFCVDFTTSLEIIQNNKTRKVCSYSCRECARKTKFYVRTFSLTTFELRKIHHATNWNCQTSSSFQRTISKWILKLKFEGFFLSLLEYGARGVVL